MARQTHHQSQHQGCGQDCTYRGLYEGTQASLADMARRQTEALRRVGRLRAAIVMLLKRHFPQAFTQAEANIGTRLSESDDEVLLAYLTGFVGNNPDGSSEQYIMLLRKLSMLKTELLAAGIPISNDDPQTWVETIRVWRKHIQPELTNATGEQPRTFPDGNNSAIVLIKKDQETSDVSTKSEEMTTKAPLLGELFGESKSDLASRKSASQAINPTSLGDLFGDSEPSNANVPTNGARTTTDGNGAGQTLGDIFGAPNPRVWSGELGEPGLDDSGRWLPTPLQAPKKDNPFLNEKVDEVVAETPEVDSSKRIRSSTKLNPTTQPIPNPSENNIDNSENQSVASTNTNQPGQDLSTASSPKRKDDTERVPPPVENGEVNWVNPFDAPPGLLPDFDIEKDTELSTAHKRDALNGNVTTGNDNTTPQDGSNLSAGTDNMTKVVVTQHTQGVSQPLRPELFPIARPAKTNRRGCLLYTSPSPRD